MTTTASTPVQNTTDTTTTAAASTSTGTGSRGRTLFVSAIGVVVGAGLTAGLVLGLGAATAPAAGTPVAISNGTSTSGQLTLPASGTAHHTTPAHPVTPRPPAPPAPSATVMTLQRELGQLNYYEGPITGTMNPQTVQAIQYLQRDAHLPQTGSMNAATSTALANFLANGNNQMGS